MTKERPFNLDLLKQPTKSKLQYFRDVIVPHRNIKQILDLLLKNAIEPDDASVYLVFGVTGVGKTRLMQEFQKRMVKHFMGELIENPGSLIVGGIEVDSAEGGKFNYSDYYIQVLEALREVLIDYKITYDIDSAEQSDADALLGTFESKNSKALRRAMQKVFVHRQVKAFTLDEAQHLFDVAGGKQRKIQMNWLKSIANKTQTIHVLFGTYELLDCQIIIGIGELIATAPILDSPPTLPDMIQKLKLIQFSFERSLRQDITQFVSLGKTLEQLKIAIAQHPVKPLNLVSLLIPVCNSGHVSITQIFQEDISGISKILKINFNSQV